MGAKVGYSADGATVLGKDDDGRDRFSLRLPFDENCDREIADSMARARHKVYSSFRAYQPSTELDFLIPGGKLPLLPLITVLRCCLLPAWLLRRGRKLGVCGAF